MIGSFLTIGLVLAFGYAYPAYECYKTVEKNRPEIEQLRFWCQYWILVAVLTVCERVGEAFISWVPMYSEAKLAFFIYLWPYVSKHESDIDRNLLELRTCAGDIVVLYWQRAASYWQTRVFDILQYIASQSTPNSCPVQQQQPGTWAPPTRRPSTPTVPAEVEAVVPKAAPSVSALAAPKGPQPRFQPSQFPLNRESTQLRQKHLPPMTLPTLLMTILLKKH